MKWMRIVAVTLLSLFFGSSATVASPPPPGSCGKGEVRQEGTGCCVRPSCESGQRWDTTLSSFGYLWGWALFCSPPDGHTRTPFHEGQVRNEDTQGQHVVGESCVQPPPKWFVTIPAGRFTQGSPSDEKGRDNDEAQREVTISRAFWLQATEVTQGQWRALMGNNPSYFSSCGDQCPAERVSWYEAVTYLNHLSEREGLETCYTLSGCSGTLGGGCASSENNGYYCTGDYSCSTVSFKGLSCEGYRLPTEAEWEYAVRAGTTGVRYAVVLEISWFKDSSGEKNQRTGGNPWGLYDMLGNVWEWTGDWYERERGSSTVTDPEGPSAGSNRVVRGCFWRRDARPCRAADRSNNAPTFRIGNVGFRAARSIP